MKSKDQTLLEEAYESLLHFDSLDKEKERLLRSIEYTKSLLQKSLNMAKHFSAEEGGHKAAMEDVEKLQSFIDKDKRDLKKVIDQILAFEL